MKIRVKVNGPTCVSRFRESGVDKNIGTLRCSRKPAEDEISKCH